MNYPISNNDWSNWYYYKRQNSKDEALLHILTTQRLLLENMTVMIELLGKLVGDEE